MFGPQSMPTPSDQAAAEGRASLYALQANAWRDPDAALLDALLGLGDRGLIAPRKAFPDSVHASIRGLLEACRRFRDSAACDALAQLRAEHVRLFGHSIRGSCPPYELEYGRGEIVQQTAELADIAGFYSAFGMQLAESAFERADHVAVECEFLSVLCAKEAWGRQQDDRDLVETCCDAQRLFLRDHLAKWLPAFVGRVEAADAGGLYGRFATLASAFIHDECRRFEIEVGPQWLDLRPADVERDSTIDCDTAGCGDAGANALVQLGTDTRSGQRK